jgi:uncharacterized protein (DUF1330 family)
MAAYLIVDVEVKDAKAYEPYRAGVGPVIQKHGGEYLVRGGQVEVVEGTWKPSRVVVLRFPDRKALDGFLNDPDYAPLKAVRQRSTRSDVVAVDGV